MTSPRGRLTRPARAAATALATLGALALTVGCGSASEPEAGAASASSAPAAENPETGTPTEASGDDDSGLPAVDPVTADPCSLLSSADVSIAVNGAAREGVSDFGGCEFTIEGAAYTVFVSAQSNPDAGGDRAKLKAYLAESAVVPVSVGDEAAFVAAFQGLAFRVGGKYASVALNGPPQQNAEQILTALATALAVSLG